MSHSAMKRLWKNFPLQRLKQGSKLTIRSRHVLDRFHVKIVSGWRDDGQASLEQVFATGGSGSASTNKTIDWKISEQQQQQPSDADDGASTVGRMNNKMPPHVVVDVFETTKSAKESSSLKKDPSAPFSTPTKETDKIIFDDGSIQPIDKVSQVPPVGSKDRVDYHDGVAHWSEDDNKNSTSSAAAPGSYLTIHTPESIHLDVEIATGNITVQNKVEGDVKLKTGDGDISVQKVRGHVVHLQAQSPGNVIYSSALLEARDLSVHTQGRFRAKQCHGSNIEVLVAHNNSNQHESSMFSDTNDPDDEQSLIDMSSLFVSGDGTATIQCESQRLQRRAVRIKSHHGAVHVDSKSDGQIPLEMHPHTHMPYPLVELGGVNGCCEVFCQGPDSAVPSDWISCLVHVDSLLPDHISIVAADHGSMGITLDRKVEAELRLASLPSSVVTEAAVTMAEEDAELLVKVLQNIPPSGSLEEKKNDKTISIQTDSFTEGTRSFSSPHLIYRDGSVANKSAEPDSRFDRKGAGKVNAQAAMEQAFAGFSSETVGTTTNRQPLLAAVCSGRIVVETVSWLGAIARRYGLDESSERQLGRTASRSGRELIDR